MLAAGLLSTAILGALAAQWSMTRASQRAALREQAFLLADARVEAERSGAGPSIDWAFRARALPHGSVGIAPADRDRHGVTVAWDERAGARHSVTLSYRAGAPS